jgi:hypothetical protein
MKTINVTRIIVIALIVGFISTFSSYAKSPAAMAAQKVQQKISDVVQNMEDPENTPSSGTVVIVFTFNDEGKIEIKKIDSNNDEAENFVVKKISTITYKNFVDPYHKLYKIKFRFDQI